MENGFTEAELNFAYADYLFDFWHNRGKAEPSNEYLVRYRKIRENRWKRDYGERKE